MKAESESAQLVAGQLPTISLANAEKILRVIARRNGWLVRKRRSLTLKHYYGNGYAIIDRSTNCFVSGVITQDGCDLGLQDLAKELEDDEDNTPWQKMVINAILHDKVSD